MLKDHVDFDKLVAETRAWMAGTGPKPADIATWRRARDGEVCGGCGRAFRPGSFVQVAHADESIGHAHCHVGTEPIRVLQVFPSRGGRA